MTHSIIGRALLLGTLLLVGVAHAETEDIPLPGDVQSAPAKTIKQSTRHQGGGVVAQRGGKKQLSAMHSKGSGHAHAKRKAKTLRKAGGVHINRHKAKVSGKGAANHAVHPKKIKVHKPSKNNNIKKNIRKKSKKTH